MANLWLDAKELLGQADDLNYINYDTLKEDNKEFLRTDVWDFQFIDPPHAVYFPGNAMLRARTQEVSPTFPTGLGEITAVIRQFTIRQTVLSGTTAGTVSMTILDREDQAMSLFVDDWRDKLGGRDNRYTFRKEDTVATAKLTMFNSSRVAIRTYMIYGVQIQESAGTINPQFNSEDAQQAGTINLTLSFEHFELTWENI